MKVRIEQTTMLPTKTTTPATMPTAIPVTATLLSPPRAEREERRREVKCKGEEAVEGTEEGVVR